VRWFCRPSGLDGNVVISASTLPNSAALLIRPSALSSPAIVA